jgi:molybdenum cofactor cytidylyltransferase
MAHGFEVALCQPVAAGAVEVNPRGHIAGVILSGGASRRMGTPKALLQYQGETFLDRLIRLFSAVCDPVVVVLGHDASRIQAGLKNPGEALFVVNPDPDRGMLSSLQCGAGIPACLGLDAVLFTPVDHPNIEASTLATLSDSFFTHRAPVTVPVFLGRKGHPVCISREVIGQLLALPPTSDTGEIIRAHPIRRIEVDDPGVVSDIDDPQAYAALNQAANL